MLLGKFIVTAGLSITEKFFTDYQKRLGLVFSLSEKLEKKPFCPVDPLSYSINTLVLACILAIV